MSTTTSMYDKMITEFQEKWEGNSIDLMRVAMMLDASKVVLQTALGVKPTPNQVIAMAGVIAKMN